jgi:hypothetical protein
MPTTMKTRHVGLLATYQLLGETSKMLGRWCSCAGLFGPVDPGPVLCPHELSDRVVGNQSLAASLQPILACDISVTGKNSFVLINSLNLRRLFGKKLHYWKLTKPARFS